MNQGSSTEEEVQTGHLSSSIQRNNPHPRQAILICKLLPECSRQGGQPSAGPVGADALVSYALCGEIKSAFWGRPMDNAWTWKSCAAMPAKK